MNVRLARDDGCGERVAMFASKRAKVGKTGILMIVDLACNRG